MLPVWAIPLLVQVASTIIDIALRKTLRQPTAKRNEIYDKLMKKNPKALTRMRGK
jgi:hypothetical protein